MSSKLENNLKQVFSLLPDRQAAEAYQQLLADIDNDSFNLEAKFEWADFSLSGAFLRGGISEIASQKSIVIANSQEDPEIAEIVRWTKAQGAQAGALHWAANKERIYWFLPLTHSKIDQFTENRIRGFSISKPVFHAIINLFNAGANLSQSEERVIYQLVAGVELRVAAETDGISYETKRAHVKSTCEKLFCKGQKDIVRKVLGQMVYLLALSDADVIHTETVENFVTQFLAKDVRFSIQRLKNGRLIRILECGPADGTPVIMVHGIMFPIILCGLARHLEKEKIRLIVPVRSGFLENVPNPALYTTQGLITCMLEDIALFIEQNNLSPAIVIGQSLGAVVAIRFASLYPQLVSRLVLLSINFARRELNTESKPGNFYGALRNLKIDPALFNMVNLQLVKYYSRQDTCREILATMFKKSQSDIEVLEGKFSNISSSELFSKVAQDSMFGITADFSFSMKSWRAETQELKMPITFIHGRQDPLTQLDEADEIFNLNKNCTALFVANGGHFVSVSHANVVWPHIAQLAKGGA